MEFFKDEQLDTIIKDVIDIFNLEGVELVRISGLLNREIKLSKKNISKEELERLIYKLYQANIINYKSIYKCPHCGEKSYIIIENLSSTKLCDTCKTMYTLIENTSKFTQRRNK